MLPPSVPDSITIDGKAYTLTEKEKGLVQEKYETYYNEAIGKLVENSTYTNMGDAEQAETIDRAFGYIKEKALHDVTGKKAANSTLVAHTIGYDKAAIVNQRISAIEGDKDKYGETITGSRKKKIASYLSKQPLSDGARILMLYANGFGYNDGDIGGMSKSTARSVLLKYIANNKRLTKEEKIQLAKMCDFTVKNGNIVP
jgi:hypothetical protein